MKAALIAAIVALLVLVAASLSPRRQAIPCDLADFHPDFTSEMRQACREARRQK